MISEEIWKDIPDYEGLYMVSNLGRVKSLKRNTAHERIMCLKKDKGGYLYVGLSKNGIVNYKKVHRLVAQAFIPNLENKYSVNHIDGNKQNNRLDNLEWATAKEQAFHALSIGLWKRSKKTNDKIKSSTKPRYKQVIQKDDDGNIIKIWDSISNASREIGVPVPHIVRVCKGIRKHARGFIWEYYLGGDV